METFTEDQVLVVERGTDHTVTETKVAEPIIVDSKKTIVIQQEVPGTIYVGSVGPQGPGGAVGEIQFNTLVAVGETRTLDSVNTALVDSVIWEVTVIDRSINRKRVSAVRATESESAAFYTIGPICGALSSTLPYLIDVNLVAGELVLSLENNHTNEVVTEVLRIKTDRALV